MKKAIKKTLKHLTQLLLIFAILLVGFWLRLEYAGEVDTGFSIAQSLRFNDNDSPYLERTPASAGNQKTWTWSAWLKIGNIPSNVSVLEAGTDGVNRANINFTPSAQFSFYQVGAGATGSITSDAVFRDPSKWVHFILAVDTTEAVSTDRVKLYADGVQLTTTTTGDPGLNADLFMNRAVTHRYSSLSYSVANFFDAYLSDTYFIDGQALTPSDFGETDTNGYWRPKAYSGTYGTNGYHLNFADSADLGNDVSGNANDWTSNNLDATDQVIDTPTNSFATINPVSSGAGVFSQGNLQYVSTADTGDGTIGAKSGKYYWEVTVQSNSNSYIGVLSTDELNPNRGGSWTTHGAIAYKADGNQYYTPVGGSSDTVAYGSSYTSGDIIGVALDIDSDQVTFYKNDTSQGVAAHGPSEIRSGGSYSSLVYGGSSNFLMNFGANAQTGLTYYAAAGGYFKYEPPTGFKALSTNNLPTPAIEQPNQYFEAKLYTGTATLQSITSLNFQPTLTWIKDRTSTNAHGLFDAIRNTYPYLSSNATTVETSSTNALTSFLENGFTLGSNSLFNTNTNNYVSWNWKEDATSGFDIVNYTGTGVARTVTHSLGVKPAMMIVKNRDTASPRWAVYHHKNTSAPETDVIYLNETNATADTSAFWNDTAPSTTEFTVGTDNDVNTNGDDYIAYLFAEKEGYSKFGSYTGNGSADGPFVYLGFKPAYVMVKRTNTTGNWLVTDNARSLENPNGSFVRLNTNATEGTLDTMDLDSNGFKIRTTDSGWNTSGHTYVYAAFAEKPFKESAEAYNLTIDESVRFNDNDSAYLGRTPASAGDRKTWTWSGWVKRGNLGVQQNIFSGYDGTTANYTLVRFNSSDTLEYVRVVSSGIDAQKISSAVYRDPSEWMHIVIVEDALNTNASIYVNGSEVAYDTNNEPSNVNGGVNTTSEHRIGSGPSGVSTSYLDAYLSETHFIDGQALTPSDFGETDTNGYWRPKAYGGTYGTNGYHLDFANPADLGNDVSGNANDWTSNNLDATDQVTDTPTNSFATFNPLAYPLANVTGTTHSQGNLQISRGASWGGSVATIPIPMTGKWAFKAKILGAVSGTNTGYIGIGADTNGEPISSASTGNTASWYTAVDIHGIDGGPILYKFSGGSDTLHYSGSSSATNDEYEFLIDRDAGTVDIKRNGVAYGTQLTGLPATHTLFPYASVYSETILMTFDYTPSEVGYNVLSTNNLPTPVIEQPNQYFTPALYTGTATLQSITSLNFQPALTWLKDRTSANAHGLFDAIRNTYPYLSSNATTVETSGTDTLTSFLENGFTLGSNSLFNTNTNNYVSWNWKEDVVSGFDIVEYVGDGIAGHQVSHSLAVSPAFAIFKSRETTDGWFVQGNNIGNPEDGWYLSLQTTNARASSSNVNTTFDTNTVSLDVTHGYNELGTDYIAYLWAEKEGFSKFGSYTGNGSADGPFVYLGFKPAYVMTKRTDSTSGWVTHDSARSDINPSSLHLRANVNAADDTGVNESIDILSNGFKLRGAGGNTNISSGDYVYAAFAEQPLALSAAPASTNYLQRAANFLFGMQF